MGTSLSSLFYVVGFKFNMKKCNFVQPEIKFVPAQIDKIHGVRQPARQKLDCTFICDVIGPITYVSTFQYSRTSLHRTSQRIAIYFDVTEIRYKRISIFVH
jgi:hypothetical protein